MEYMKESITNSYLMFRDKTISATTSHKQYLKNHVACDVIT